MRCCTDLAVVVRTALLCLVALTLTACGSVEKTPGEPAESAEPTARAGSPETNTPEAATASTPEAEAEKPGSAPGDVAAASPNPAAAPETGGTPERAIAGTPIQPVTRRTAAGLPDPVPGYQSWYRLPSDPASAGEADSFHLPMRQAYVQLPTVPRAAPGVAIEPPLPEGSVLALESKSPQADYIEKISVMKKEGKAWKYFQYSRSTDADAFAPVTGAASGCAGCHGRATGTDGVFSKLVPQ